MKKYTAGFIPEWVGDIWSEGPLSHWKNESLSKWLECNHSRVGNHRHEYKARQVSWGQILQSLVNDSKCFGLYPRSNREPLRVWNEVEMLYMIKFDLSKDHFGCRAPLSPLSPITPQTRLRTCNYFVDGEDSHQVTEISAMYLLTFG